MRVAEISLTAIARNVEHLRAHTNSNVIAVIKANGYGHGSVFAARAAIAGGAILLGVADLEEALALREQGINDPLMCWLHGAGADYESAVAERIEIGVSHLPQLEAVAEASRKLGQTATIHFKVDTGLSRNGASADEWAHLFRVGAQLHNDGLVHIRGIFSHLANVNREEDFAQAARFDQAVSQLGELGVAPELVHLQASAAALRYPEMPYNTIRVGMACFGLSPFANVTSAELGLVPAMTLKSEIVSLRDVPPGTGVSYGYNHVVQSETTLGLVPIGYADGMPRALNGSGATVAIAGQHCPIVGRIGMDQCIVDLGKMGKKIQLGESVVLFGDPATGVPPVELWAEILGTINYEIVVGIGPRVLRVAAEASA